MVVKDKRDKKGLFEAIKIATTIKKTASDRPVKDYNSGLAGEHMIVSSLSLMKIPDLEQLRYLVNEMIKEKKIYKRVNEKKKVEINEI